MLDVRTIGAGGGSVAWIDKGGLLRVGPRSAGATPGPVCYRRGGTEPTVTDANVVLGRINPRYFLGGKFELDEEAARLALRRLGEELSMSVEEVAGSIVELVDFNMVDAIRLVSIDRGLDPREFTLVSFGGAGSLHAGSLAEIIGIGDVLVPIHQGVFSALGLMTADMRVDESVTANFRSDLLYIDRLNALFDRVRHGSLARLHAEGYRGSPVVEESIEMRYLGQNYSTEVALPEHSGVLGEADLEEVYSRFHAEHRRLYGYDIPAEIVEFVTVKVTAIGVTDKPTVERLERRGDLTAKGHRRVFFRVDARWTDLETAVYERDLLPPGAWLDGPAVIEEETSTTLVHPSQRLEVDEYGNLFIHTTVGGHPR
jgi:N-methylhydantoinase A